MRAFTVVNLGIKKIGEFNDLLLHFSVQTQRRITDRRIKGLRAFYYFQLVQQLGDIPLITEPCFRGNRISRKPVAAIL
jgi:hypothetical protein